MESINSKKIAEVVHSPSAVVDVEIRNIVTDSRKAHKTSMFVAIKGEKFDGHDFVKEVIQQGCPLALVSRLLPDVPAMRQFVVPDVLDAYGKIGRYIRQNFKGKVIGLTGSAGKTTTKEEIKFVLSRFTDVYATEGNHNNFIGVPESLCNMSYHADYAIIEMGMSAKGEISRLTSYVKPDIAIVTNVYPMHIEFFENFKGIAEAKAEIFEGLAKGGTAIINGDTNYADLLVRRADEHQANVLLFGSCNCPEVVETEDGCQVKAVIGGKKLCFELSESGEHHVANALCVLTVVEALGLDVEKAATFLKDFRPLPGRGQKRILKLADGGHYTLIDDSYSGQPEAMKLAIQNLAKQKGGRRIAVLGKMAELGDTSKAQHIEVGQCLKSAGIDVVVGVCPEMKDTLAQLDASQKTYYFENQVGLDEFLLNNLLQNNDIVLIKGARYSSKLYQVAESLIKKGEA